MSGERPQIIGRERELQTAMALLEGVHGGARGLILQGEAGIGKTTLWLAILEQAQAHGFHALRCQPERSQLAFAGLSELLDPSTDRAIAALSAPQREALEIALLRRDTDIERSPDRRTLGVALHSLLCELAREAPLVLAIDDLQWLDPSTLRLLAFAVRRLEDHRVAIVLSERGPPFTLDPFGIERALGSERLARLQLDGLSEGEIPRLLEHHLGRSYPRRVISRLAQASAGNPLFALECARALQSTGEIDATGALPVPESLRELVRGRLHGLAPDAREALLATATLARATTTLVEQASSAQGLAGAEQSDLLRVEQDRLRFVHPLYASAVYDAAETSQRRAMHRRLAELLDDRDERTRHLALASEGSDETVALELERAATRARARGASAAAAGLLKQSIALTPANLRATSLRRMAQAAEDHLLAGEGERPRKLLEAVVDGLPAGSDRARALRALGQVGFWHDSYPQAQRLLSEALGEAGEDEWIRARTLLDLSWIQSQCGQHEGLMAQVATALEISERIGDPQLLGEALAASALLERMLGGSDVEQKLQRALALEQWDTRTFMGLWPSVNAAWVCLWTGRLEQAASHLSGLQEQSLANGQEFLLPLVGILSVWIECAAGHLTRAGEIGEQAVGISLHSDSRIVRAAALGARGMALGQLGALERAESDVRDSMAMFEAVGDTSVSHGVLTGALGFMALSAGDHARVHELLEPLAEMALEHGIGEPMLASFLPSEIEALIGLGQLDRAARLIELLACQGERSSSAWALASACRCGALLAAAQGDLPGASDALERAIAHHEGLGMPLELARTLLIGGQLRRRERQKRAAGESLRAALSIFEGCGAAQWAQKARAEIARLGTRTAPKDLSATERRVATLAAAGMTNKDIAAELFISPKTVEANLSRAYRKLAISSRAQLSGAIGATGEPAGSSER